MEADATLDALEPIFDELKPYLVSLAVILARPVGLIAIFPVFTRAEIGRVVRTGFAIALVLPMFGALHAQRMGLVSAETVADPVFSNAAQLTVLGLKEFAVGFLLAVILAIPFWAIQTLGELVDLQRGVTVSAIDDPSTQAPASVTNTLLTMSAIVIFVSAGGLLITAEALYLSYTVWPLDVWLPDLSLEGFLTLGGTLDGLFRYALLVGGPFLILFLLSDIAVGLAERFAPRISSFALSPIIKNLIFVVLFALYASFLVTYMTSELATTRAADETLRSLIAPPPDTLGSR